MGFGFKRLAGVAVVATGLSVATYAFTASNTVPGSKAGSGSGTISGYEVSTVKYNLDAADPQKIASVTFSLDAAPSTGATLKVRLVDAATDWYTCSVSGTPAVDVSCTTTGATVAAADNLTVVVAN